MGEVELDRSTATSGEVNEKRPSPPVQKAARARLAVQDLVAGLVDTDRVGRILVGGPDPWCSCPLLRGVERAKEAIWSCRKRI
jgi:hypothetical protein